MQLALKCFGAGFDGASTRAAYEGNVLHPFCSKYIYVISILYLYYTILYYIILNTPDVAAKGEKGKQWERALALLQDQRAPISLGVNFIIYYNIVI